MASHAACSASPAMVPPQVPTNPLLFLRQLPPIGNGSEVISEMLHSLMATNPRAFDKRATIGLKVTDKVLMLDNPAVKQSGTSALLQRKIIPCDSLQVMSMHRFNHSSTFNNCREGQS